MATLRCALPPLFTLTEGHDVEVDLGDDEVGHGKERGDAAEGQVRLRMRMRVCGGCAEQS